MKAHARRGILPALLLLASSLSCSSTTYHETEQPSPPNSYYVTAEKIAESGATTAWDALRLTVPVLTFRETSSGTPAHITRRGKTSLLLDDRPRVFIDRLPLLDLSALDQMPASILFSIEVLSGVDGTTYFGTNAVNGVILIRTRTGKDL